MSSTTSRHTQLDLYNTLNKKNFTIKKHIEKFKQAPYGNGINLPAANIKQNTHKPI